METKKLAIVGYGQRGNVYANYALQNPEEFVVTAVIDNDEGKVSGFTILYIQDGKKHLMELKDVTLINNHQVEIKLPQIDGEIFELLYLWADNPYANLYTDLEIPVAPFRCAL